MQHGGERNEAPGTYTPAAYDYSDTMSEVKDKTSGIGLNNVKRRLNLLYHQNHTLAISRNDGWYLVQLQLNLH